MWIDFHTHVFPDAIAVRALERLTANARAFQETYGPVQPHTDATVQGLTASSRAAGLDISVVMPIATSPKPSPTLNDFAAQVDRMPGLRSFGSVHPRQPRVEEELDRVQALGLRGIKLHPEYQDCFADDPDVVAVVRAAVQRGLTVLFHAGRDIGKMPPVHCTPRHIARLREAVPEGRLIFAHMGGYRLWDEVEQVLPGLDVLIDTSFCLPNHREAWSQFARIVRAVGVDHVLFGSDSPWGDQKAAVQAAREWLTAYEFTAEEQTAILGGNAAKILEVYS